MKTEAIFASPGIYTTFLVNSYLSKAGIPTLPHRPLAQMWPRASFMFPRLKRPIKDKHFETTEGIQAACAAAFKTILENASRDDINAWKSRWQRCVDAEGAYFESFKRILTLGSTMFFISTQSYHFLDNAST